MKSICLSIAFLCTALLAAQGQDYPQSISAYVNLWPLYSSHGNSTSTQAPGIRQVFKQTPFLMGIDLTQRLNKRWHYFLSVQSSLYYITNLTTITPPQPLSPSTVCIQGQTSDFEAFQVMVGGGAQYRILEKKWTFIHLSAGLFGAYTHDRNETAQGIELLNSTFNWEAGGTVEHSVTRRFMPVGRLGMGGQYIFQRAPRFSIGAEVFYYVAPRFIEGSWSRDLPGTNTLATQGSYQAGLNNLMLVPKISFRF